MDTEKRISAEYICNALSGELVNTLGVDLWITGVQSASAKILPGQLFVAISGNVLDGHQFISEAFDRGATLAVVSDPASLNGKPGIIVSDTRRALSQLAALFAGYPTEQMRVVGITGTNGKTTTHWIVHHLFEALGVPALRIGTIGVAATKSFAEQSDFTTPAAPEIHGLFARALGAGVKVASMEVSSHSLAQHRVSDIAFDVAIFTNLTHDHLDYHGTMEAYGQAKAILFKLLKKGKKEPRTAVVNADDPFSDHLVTILNDSTVRMIRYGKKPGSELCIVDAVPGPDGTSITFMFAGALYEVVSPYRGWFNAYNLMAAIGALLGIGFGLAEIIGVVPALPQVPGRLELMRAPNLTAGMITVYVDYAHTPDALEKALRSLREISKGKLWVLFGCGGDRDRSKRPRMAAVAATFADVVVVTSDNPRTEEPSSIIKEILSEGIETARVDPDRRSAIAATVAALGAGDVLLVAGKGHEDYQIIGTTKYPFSDQEEVRRALSMR